MNNLTTTETLTWQDFKNILMHHPNQTLQFQYEPGKWVDASYHITEIKQALITSVDCGGKMNNWTEVIIQLWEPFEKDSQRAMPVSKALSIINLVEKHLPLHLAAIVKMEYGNAAFAARQLYPVDLTVEGENLLITLSPGVTECKAIGRGESCGTPQVNETCCTPGSGCC